MRTFVSVFGIAVGVFLVIFTIGLADGTLRGNAQREANVGAEIMVRASGTFGRHQCGDSHENRNRVDNHTGSVVD